MILIRLLSKKLMIKSNNFWDCYQSIVIILSIIQAKPVRSINSEVRLKIAIFKKWNVSFASFFYRSSLHFPITTRPNQPFVVPHSPDCRWFSTKGHNRSSISLLQLDRLMKARASALTNRFKTAIHTTNLII